ncbi:monooxygenase FAD-binding protein [Mucor ambiguus]|uniref:Monooxygenase FAD-binding protein n=1 Tax=Mucor ambiguus TaxID=91626 RepID=A0A0C9MDF3_9FUNG|nr:monooxygenase FAD-binding protein [Mucor ambiguus]
MTPQRSVYDVIICGAGPVGLFFAYQMIMQGHSVYICDQKQGPTSQSRAFFVTARSLEIFENNGIAHRLLQEAYVLRGAKLFIEGCETTSIEADDVGEAIFPQLTSIPQSRTESVLASLIEKQATIHWNTKLESYTTNDDSDFVTAVIVHGDDKTKETVQGKYIVGADGAHSTVRHLDPTWTYEGYSANTQFALADVMLSGPSMNAIKDTFNIFYHSEGMVLLIPINYDHSRRKSNLFRIIANKGPYERRATPKKDDTITHGICEDDAEHLSIEEVNEILKARADSLDLTASNPAWLTHFYINSRKANGFRRGKAFLIGDAAHCHSPVGGQGMNLGLQDADNLAWKMSLVLKGSTSNAELLLDSYSIEREPAAENVISQTDNATELAMSVSFVMAIFRYFVSSSSFSLSKLKEYGMSTLLQLHLALEASSPIVNKVPKPPLIEASKFLPETALLLKRSIANDRPEHLLERKTLHQIVSNTGKHAALWISTRPAAYASSPLTSLFWSKLQTSFRDSIRPVIVESMWHVPEYSLAKDIETKISELCENDEQRMVIAKKLESENFWVEYHPSSSYDSITKMVGLQEHLDKCSADTEHPPSALVIVRPDLYIAHSTLINTEEDIDKAFEFLHTYLL